MKKGKTIRKCVLLLAVLLAGYLGIRFYPVWKAAKYLQENLDPAHFAYELEVELDREALAREGGRMPEVLTKLTGFTEGEICRPTVRGEVSGDLIHALVYPEGAASPLVELYLGDDTDVINETLIYNAVQNHLTEQFALLGLVLPEQKEELYMTLEQVEKIFGLDLGKVRDFRLEGIPDSLVTGKCFLLLAAMSREKAEGGSLFSFETEGLKLQSGIPQESGAMPLTVRLDIEDPAALAGKASRAAGILSWFGFGGFPEAEQLTMVKRISVTIEPCGEDIELPGNYVNQDIVELLRRLREWGQKLINGGDGKPETI